MSRRIHETMMWASMIVILVMTASCTSTGSEDSGGVVPGGEGILGVASPTRVPLVTPTPAIPDTGEGPLIVGSLLAQSGVMEKKDLPALLGVRVRIEQLNEQGGLLGRMVELVEIDTGSRLGAAQAGADELVRLGVDLLLVSCDPTRASPALEVAEEHGVLAISPCGADEAWLGLGDLAFSMSVSAAHEGQVLATWAVDNGLASTVVLKDNTNPDVETFCDSFVARYRSLGGSIVFTDEFTFDSLDPFEDRLAQRPTDTASVLVCSHLPGGLNGAPNIIELVRARGITAPILTSSALDGGPTWFNIITNLGTLTMVTPSSTHGDDPDPEVNEFVKSIDGEGGVPGARGWSVYGAAAIDAWVEGVRRAESVDGRRVANQFELFRNERFLGGTFSFASDAHMDPDRQLRVVQIVNGSPSVIDTRG